MTSLNSFSNLSQVLCKRLCQRFGHGEKRFFSHHVVMSQLASCLAISSTKRVNLSPRSIRNLSGKSHLFSQPILQSDRYKSTKCDDTAEERLTPSAWKEPFEMPNPELDWLYLLNEENTETIAENIKSRKGVGDIHKMMSLSRQLDHEENPEKEEVLVQEIMSEGLNIPNSSHPDTIHGDETCAREIGLVGEKKEFDFEPWKTDFIGEKQGSTRISNLNFAHGERCLYFEADLARLERALVNFTLDYLRNLNFEYVTVPDILHSDVVDGCGFKTNIEENAVYHIHPDCLSHSVLAGTSEMALAGFFCNELLQVEDLPVRMTAVSKCYRAEAEGKPEERGVYRVHNFTKVEMFGLSSNEDGTESNELLETFLDIQKDIFSQLGLHFRILDMPSQELGAPAHKKYDIESWMYARKMWGEISSCSNCTDFQSRRLNIKYIAPDGELKHVHTVNGTACAVPRLILSLMEQNQEKVSKYGRRIVLPEVLHPYMDGEKDIRMVQRKVPYVFIKSLRKHNNDE